MKRPWLFLIFMALFSAAYQLGSMSNVSVEDARTFMEYIEELILNIDALGIFIHNITLTLPMFIPGFGVGWGLFSAWSTGYAFAAITTLAPGAYGAPALAILYLTPFGLMELAAYTLGISRSYILISLIVKKSSLRPAVKPTLAEIGIASTLLLVGGFVEFWIIEAVRQNDFYIPGL